VLICQSSTQNVRSQIAEAQKIANGSGSEQDIAEAKIELEVRQTPLTRPEHSDWQPKTGAGEPAGRPQIDTWCTYPLATSTLNL
jgi:hypothetical protein